MNLNDLERVAPGVTGNRMKILTDLSAKVSFLIEKKCLPAKVLPITQSDLECFWVTVLLLDSGMKTRVDNRTVHTMSPEGFQEFILQMCTAAQKSKNKLEMME